jgi:autotransporter-associated beta strand protein
MKLSPKIIRFKRRAFGWSPLVGGMMIAFAVLSLGGASLLGQSITISGQAPGNGAIGDFMVGFQQTSGSTDYLIDLGQISQLVSDTTTVLNLGNYNADLRSAFGSSWYGPSDNVLWGAVAASGPTGVGSDPAATLYLTTATTAIGTPGLTLPSKVKASQNGPNSAIVGLITQEYNISASPNAQVTNASLIPNSDASGWTATVATISKSYSGKSLESPFTNATPSTAVLDLWRLAPVNGSGQNVGYLSIDNLGNMIFTPYAMSSGGGGSGGSGSYAGPWIWTGGSGNWSVTNNWQSNAVASNGYAVGINGTSGGAITNDLVTNLSSLTFSNGAGAYTLTGTNAGQMLAISGGLTNNSASTQTIASSLAGVGNVNQSGVGTLILASSNSYSGGTILNGGTIIAVNNASFGSGSITAQSSSTITAGAPILATTNAIAIAGGANLTMDAVANNWQHAGLLSGAGSLTKSGIGTLTLSGSSTNLQGAIAVNQGTLQVSGNLGSGTVTVISGASLSGNGSIGGVQLNNGATLTGGVNGAIGQLTIAGAMTPAAGSVFNWKMADAGGSAGTGYDSFSVGGSLNLSGLGTGSTLQFNLLSPLGGVTNFLNNQNSQWLVASAGSILGFSTNDFSINTAGFANLLGGGSFSFSTNTLGNGFGLYLNFIALGVNPWTGNIAAGASTISGQTVTSTNSAVIGANASRNGSVSIVNNGAWIIPGSLTVGGSTTGNGTLTIGSGGSVQANGLKISDQAGSKGLVLIADGASPSALSLGSGTITFGQGKGQLQFAQSGAEIISNAVSGKGMIVSTGTGTTTLSGNNAGFSGTNYMSSGTEVIASGSQLGGSVNLAGKTAVLALNTGASLSSTSPVAVAGLLLDNSGLSLNNAIKGQVFLAPTGSLQKTYTLGSTVAGFGAGIGAGRFFSILAGSAASNTLSASLVNGALNFKGTFTNDIVFSMTDPSFSALKNTIQWYNTNSSKWVNTVQGNGQGGAVTNVGTNAILSLLGSTNAKLWGASGFKGSFNTFLIDIASLNLPNGLASLNALGISAMNADLNAMMGAYGYDASTHSAWAVIDHNSLFSSFASGTGLRNSGLIQSLNDAGVIANLSVFQGSAVTANAVPEPSTWALLTSVAVALFLGMLRSRRRDSPR